MTNIDYDFARAYAQGYWDGRHDGVENNIYQDSELRHGYTAGYEAGVTDYCVVDN